MLYITFIQITVAEAAIAVENLIRLFYCFHIARSVLLNIFKTFPGCVGIGSYDAISFRLFEADHATTVVHFLVWPEMPTDIVAIKHLAKTGYPFIRIFSSLTTIYRERYSGFKINIGLIQPFRVGAVQYL